jgi:LacI family transcriptional regulator
VVFAAKAAGIAIPRQIAVVGLGNEAIYCESIRPTITSIMIEQEAKGARAARLLVDIIRGAASPDTVIKIPPRGIVARESTGFGQPEDPQLERAFDSMKNWSGEMPDLSEVAANAGMSLRTLHRKVSNATGKSPAAILHILRLEKAFALLRETGLSLAEVADLAGYSLPSQLSREVKQHTGQTASAYRARWQQG